ncbi:MAG TPA: hypothetical protein VKV05_12265 [Terriglobales bacterium]|nr:hypothetical protein [Terriglobales bacterium]
MKRIVWLSLALAALAALTLVLSRQNVAPVHAAALPAVTVSVEHARPRQVEDPTQKAVARDYAAAWQAMAEALDQNRTELLGANFIGAARRKLTATVAEQRKARLHQRITDQGHTVAAIFYSADGSAIELDDTAHLRFDLMDGNTVVHSQDGVVRYVALLTAAENSWKVRVLQAVPSS